MAKKEQMTPEQKKVVQVRGRDLLVAAAAGSGKTWVLVKRIIARMKEERLDITAFLLVTFTKAAAAEMRERFTKAIEAEQEALLFAEQNGHAAPLSAGIKLRAKVVGGDAPSKAFVAATNRVGLSLNYDSMQLSDYRISCVGTALKLYDQLGEEIYCEALRHIVAAWEGRPDSFRAAVLRGVMYFVQLYRGQYSAERLVRALSGVHPMELYRISRDNPAKLPGWRRYVYPIYTTYNGKCRKDALPMKF